MQEYSFHLAPGKSVFVGRGRENEMVVADPAVSVRHLQFEWSGTELIVKDLGSSNGTFRLPQNAPFKEARFGSKRQNLELSLASKITLKIVWEPTEETKKSDSSEFTEVVSPKTQVRPRAPKTPTLSPMGASSKFPKFVARERDTRASTFETQFTDDAAATEATYVEIKQALVLLASLVLSVFSYLFSLLFWRLQLPALVNLSKEQLAQGGGFDLGIAWMGFLIEHNLFSVTLYALGIFFFWVTLPRLLLKFLDRATWVQNFNGLLFFSKAPSIIRSLIIAFWTLSFLWPGLKASVESPLLKNFRSVLRLESNLRNQRVGDPAERVQIFRELGEKLQGSSFAYAGLFNSQVRRVIEQCEGKGERPWENKKLCLVLLHAVPIESYENVKPVILSSMAAQAAILLSLEGITRVMAVEGPKSATIPFFLNSLALVGLENEQNDLNRLIYGSGLDAKQVLSALRELRRKLSESFENQMKAMKVPEAMGLQIPSPIDEGI